MHVIVGVRRPVGMGVFMRVLVIVGVYMVVKIVMTVHGRYLHSD